MCNHYGDVILGVLASQITSLTIVYSNVYSGADQRKHQSSASLAFVRGIQRRPVNSQHKWPVMLKMFHSMTSSCRTWDELQYIPKIVLTVRTLFCIIVTNNKVNIEAPHYGPFVLGIQWWSPPLTKAQQCGMRICNDVIISQVWSAKYQPKIKCDINGN